MKDIIFIDSEISNSGKICDLGALKDDNSFCHTKDKNEFKRFVSNSKYIIGHNIIDFDLKYISDCMPNIIRVIDTLFLSPLLFPKKPYHSLVKDDKIYTEDVNNPISDAKKAKDLFYNEVDKWNNLFGSLKNIFGSLLEKSIHEEAPLTLKEGSIIKNGYNAELDELRSLSSGSKDFILNIEKTEKERTGIKNLKVGFNKVFGYYIEVSKGQTQYIKEEYGYERKQTLANCERYITKELKEKENIILGAEEKIIRLEYKLFMDIRETVKRYITNLQKIAEVISEVDMLQSFSVVSDENKFVKPELTDDKVMKLVDCRHPVVEKVIKDKYVANDVMMDKNTDILLITGPNMAGKSTYMRQTAITVIMAQIGCFVPCKSAILPIFDKIFTRIGASDDLVSGESTFMVEMKEANLAISEATENSLILFDELGRGTATYDGIALAQAILEYIHDNIKAKTMFSTHYHELTILEHNLKHLKNVHVSAKEENGKITFLHKIKAGSVDKSYGIHVAGLANLPKDLINRSREILDMYEHKNAKTEVFTQTSLFELTEEEIDKSVEKPSFVEEELKQIRPLEMTPMEALSFLYNLKQKMEENGK